MVGYNLYQTSTLGMQSMSHALNTIGSNIANVNTGGFKRTDTLFETVLSQTMDKNQSDLGGVKPKDYQIIDQQGVITSTTRDLDLAIVGAPSGRKTPILVSVLPRLEIAILDVGRVWCLHLTPFVPRRELVQTEEQHVSLE